MLDNFWVVPIIILLINVVYVTLNTVRMILTLKNHRYLAALISMFEIVMYVVGLGLVLDRLDEIQNLLAYAAGFGLGVIVGIKIEEKLALGYITVSVITSDFEQDLAHLLRDRGYGVTEWVANGREGARLKMEILTPRRSELRLYNTVRELAPSAFLISHEPRAFRGGFWVKALRRGNRNHL